MESSECTMKGELDDEEKLMSPLFVPCNPEADFQAISEVSVMDYVEESENTEKMGSIQCEMKRELDNAESLMSPPFVPIESDPDFEGTSENTTMEENLETTEDREDIFNGKYAMKKNIKDAEASIASFFKGSNAESGFEKLSGVNNLEDSQTMKITEVSESLTSFLVKEEPIDAEETWQENIKLEPASPLSMNAQNDGFDKSSEQGVNVKIEDIVKTEELSEDVGSRSSLKGKKHDISKEINRQLHLDCSPLPYISNQSLSEMEQKETQKQSGRCSLSSSSNTVLLPNLGCRNVLAAASCSPATGTYLSRRHFGKQMPGERQGQHSDQTEACGCANDEENQFQRDTLQSVSLNDCTAERRFKCSHCGEGFKKKSNLLRHMRKHTGERPYECFQCGKSFKDKRSLTKHFQKQTEDSPYKCSECEKSYKESSALTRHMRKHTGDRPFKCSVCGQAFPRSDSLTAHMCKHTEERPYICSDCGKSYKERGALTRHMRKHMADQPHKCPQCGLSFSRSDHLTAHMHKHSEARPYKCSQCGISLKQRRTLIDHMLTHTGDRPFKCSHCGQSFNRSGTLTAHLRTHTGDRPYKCSQCGKSFSYRSALTNHMRTHTVDQPFKCSHCGQSFSRNGTLTAHLRKHTGDRPYKCSLCGKSFSYRSSLNNHMRTHW